jgi:hypothetical protein
MKPNETPRRGWPRGLAGWIALVIVVVTTALIGAATLRPNLGRTAREGAKPAPRHAVTIRQPAGAPVILTGMTDPHDRPITVACSTCHQTKPSNAEARLGRPLAAFHQNLAGKHGDLACAACHNPADGYQTLRLAHGASVPFSEVMQLCAQCHGPQYRDYLHGAHGGMTGYWDLSRGPRVRNNCVHCHDPHAPRYGVVQPARGPGDVPSTKKGGRHE